MTRSHAGTLLSKSSLGALLLTSSFVPPRAAAEDAQNRPGARTSFGTALWERGRGSHAANAPAALTRRFQEALPQTRAASAGGGAHKIAKGDRPVRPVLSDAVDRLAGRVFRKTSQIFKQAEAEVDPVERLQNALLSAVPFSSSPVPHDQDFEVKPKHRNAGPSPTSLRSSPNVLGDPRPRAVRSKAAPPFKAQGMQGKSPAIKAVVAKPMDLRRRASPSLSWEQQPESSRHFFGSPTALFEGGKATDMLSGSGLTHRHFVHFMPRRSSESDRTSKAALYAQEKHAANDGSDSAKAAAAAAAELSESEQELIRGAGKGAAAKERNRASSDTAARQDDMAKEQVNTNVPNNISSYPYLKLGQDRRLYVDTLRGHLHELHTKAPAEGVAWRPAKQSKPLLWVHVHKEAGTFVCLAAVVNGEKVVAPSRNCNWKAYDIMWSGNCNATECSGEGSKGIGARYFKPPSCVTRYRYFKKWNFTFGAIERELHRGDVCKQFRYGTVLRRPLYALESKVFFETKNLFTTAQKYGVPMPSGKRRFELEWFKAFLKAVFDNPNTENVYGLPAWKMLDNFKIRILLGDEAFNLGPGQIGKRHLQLAIKRLEGFDLVQILDTDDQRWDGTSAELSWAKPVTQKQNFHRRQKLLDNETMAYLMELNKFDQQLFEHFKAKEPAKRQQPF